MKGEEVGDRAIMEAVDRVAERSSYDEPGARRGQARLQPCNPKDQGDGGRHRKPGQRPLAGIAMLLKKAVGDAAIPDHDQVEEWRDRDFLLLIAVKNRDHPGFVKLVAKDGRGGHGGACEAIGTPNLHQSNRTGE